MAEEAAPDWGRLRREVPAWYRGAALGIFVHWGAYSVPAWAEPVGELGTIDGPDWFRHNPYAEWYANTIRVPDSPAAAHHRDVHGDAPYDAFLDAWKASKFDADDWVRLFARAGARYVVPTTKHHDGIALWDAPGTGERNTVHRGPRRDLVAELATATRAAGLRFGTYYSGGLDWGVTDLPPIRVQADVLRLRPRDAGYAAYAARHVHDLIERFAPDVLWNDIDWPDAGKHAGELGLFQLFERYYAAVPDGVVNDRWGDTHADFRTSEYQHDLANESAGMWEHCRGIGLSFGYNRVEDATHSLDASAVVRRLVDIVSRGGNLLLNVGPDADGRIPPVQRRVLEGLARWMDVHAVVVHDARPVDADLAKPGEDPWVRWLAGDGVVWAVTDDCGLLRLRVDADRLDLVSARSADGTAVPAARTDDGIVVHVPVTGRPGPHAIRFDRAVR